MRRNGLDGGPGGGVQILKGNTLSWLAYACGAEQGARVT